MLTFLFENLRMALRNLYLHRLRTLLTALGIIIGVAAVIVMAAIGEGTKQQAIKQMQQLGARNILIRSITPPESDGSNTKIARVLDYGIKTADLKRVQSVPGALRVVPLRETQQRVSYNGKGFNSVNAIATTPDLFPVINLRLQAGNSRLFSELDMASSEPVCVLGSEAARLMFPSEDPVGCVITLGTSSSRNVQVKVIGVLEPTGLRAGTDNAGIMLRDIDRDCYFPLTLSVDTFGTSIQKRTSGSFERKEIELSEIWIQANEMTDVEPMSGIYSNLLGMPLRQDVQVKAPVEILRKAEQMNRLFNFIMVGTASFSLLVGGIGIMNIMLATVTERTKEIGIRRALGAKRAHITLQFLIETTMISLTGGVMGIGLGIGSALALPAIIVFAQAKLFGDTSATTYPTQIANWSIIVSCVVSGLIGVSFGLYPAMKAASMNPIEALRHE